MAIRGVTGEDLKRILSENLTPSDSIKTPERLFGREKTLTTIDRAFSSPGRQIFVYGDRGVGKANRPGATDPRAVESALLVDAQGFSFKNRCGVWFRLVRLSRKYHARLREASGRSARH